MNRIITAFAASVLAAAIGGAALAIELPYTGNGDPMGLTSSNPAVVFEGAVALRTVDASKGTQVPYTGFGDPDDLI
jgi:hypothetical protein